MTLGPYTQIGVPFTKLLISSISTIFAVQLSSVRMERHKE